MTCEGNYQNKLKDGIRDAHEPNFSDRLVEAQFTGISVTESVL